MAALLVYASTAPNGWIVLASGELKIASCVVKTEGAKEDLMEHGADLWFGEYGALARIPGPRRGSGPSYHVT